MVEVLSLITKYNLKHASLNRVTLTKLLLELSCTSPHTSNVAIKLPFSLST